MENVYDLVTDFYDNDEGWNNILERECAEGFLRRQAWKGQEDAELKKHWNIILMLCIYVAHTDKLLGDLTVDDLIDCVAWCARNVSGFPATTLNVVNFLDTLGELFGYLKAQHYISSNVIPYMAKSALINDDGTLAIINTKGEFLPGEEYRWDTAIEDGAGKIFLDVGESMNKLLEEMHILFQEDRYNLDLERGIFFYQGFTLQNDNSQETENDSFWQTFWDYFLFDYHLIIDDRTPLAHFALKAPDKHQALVKELCQSRLAIFTVDDFLDGDMYACTDFFTGEKYELNLPISPDMNLENTLLLGHIFYNQTMVMNYVRCFKIPPLSSKRLYNQLVSFYEWYKIQEPQATREDFIARHPMVLRRAIYFTAHVLPFVAFPYKTKVTDYQPPELKGGRDRVVDCMEKMMVPQHFTCHDVILAMKMWLDFLALKGEMVIDKPEPWAGGIIFNFVQLNCAYNYDEKSVAEMCWHMPQEDLRRTAAEIKAALKLEEFDPRYCNEEGFLTMLISEGNQ